MRSRAICEELAMLTLFKKPIAAVLIAAASVVAPEVGQHTAVACDLNYYYCGDRELGWYGRDYNPNYGYGGYVGYDYDNDDFYDLRNRCYRYGGYQIYEIPCYPYRPN
jgi:hypothetical protein